eukprot:9275114-Pyramimonas_sp.AAC.1
MAKILYSALLKSPFTRVVENILAAIKEVLKEDGALPQACPFVDQYIHNDTLLKHYRELRGSTIVAVLKTVVDGLGTALPHAKLGGDIATSLAHNTVLPSLDAEMSLDNWKSMWGDLFNQLLQVKNATLEADD